MTVGPAQGTRTRASRRRGPAPGSIFFVSVSCGGPAWRRTRAPPPLGPRCSRTSLRALPPLTGRARSSLSDLRAPSGSHCALVLTRDAPSVQSFRKVGRENAAWRDSNYLQNKPTVWDCLLVLNIEYLQIADSDPVTTGVSLWLQPARSVRRRSQRWPWPRSACRSTSFLLMNPRPQPSGAGTRGRREGRRPPIQSG